jgi:hypothetical protein
MQKALIQMNVQLHIALSDISGVSGQAIIRALLAGERDAKVLAGLRDPRCQASEEEIVQSLQGNWKEDVLFELQPALDAYDFYQMQMAKCDQQLQRSMAILPTRAPAPAPASASSLPSSKKGKQARARKPRKPVGNPPAFDLAVERERILGVNATTIDGIDVMTIQTLLAEVGPDLSAHQPGRQCLSHGRPIAGAQSKLFRSPLPIFTSQVRRTESRESQGTLFGLSVLSTTHPRTDLVGSGYRGIQSSQSAARTGRSPAQSAEARNATGPRCLKAYKFPERNGDTENNLFLGLPAEQGLLLCASVVRDQSAPLTAIRDRGHTLMRPHPRIISQ